MNSRTDYQKQYYQKNKEKLKANQKKYYNENKEDVTLRQRQYHQENKEQRMSYSKEYYQKNKNELREQRKVYQKEYYKNNKEQIAAKYAMYYRRRLQEDPLFKFTERLRTNTYRIFRGEVKKSKRTEEILGCSFVEAKKYIETLFTEGMSWDNFGEWHIDHIVPISLAQSKEEAILFSHYTNLQPLWASDNLKKSNKLTEKGKKLLTKLKLDS